MVGADWLAIKVGKILKGSLDLIPSPSSSVKIQIGFFIKHQTSSNFDKRCSDAHFVPFLSYYYCKPERGFHHFSQIACYLFLLEFLSLTLGFTQNDILVLKLHNWDSLLSCWCMIIDDSYLKSHQKGTLKKMPKSDKNCQKNDFQQWICNASLAILEPYFD